MNPLNSPHVLGLALPGWPPPRPRGRSRAAEVPRRPAPEVMESPQIVPDISIVPDLLGFNGISPRKMVIYWDLMGFHQEKW